MTANRFPCLAQPVLVQSPALKELRQVDEGSAEYLPRVLELASAVFASWELPESADAILSLGEAIVRGRAGGETPEPAGILLLGSEAPEWAATHGMVAEPLRQEQVELGIMARSIEEGTPLVELHPESDAGLTAVANLNQCAAVVCVPLVARQIEPQGLLLVGSSRQAELDEAAVSLLVSLGRHAAGIVHSMRVYQALMTEKERLSELQEEARKRLARDLHDGPTQTIASIAMRANFAGRQVPRDPDLAVREMEKIEVMARQTTREIRHMLFTLRPLILESQGLIPALWQLAERVEETADELVHVEAAPDVIEGVDKGTQAVLFYIVEEAVNNATKHAAAQNIWIRLRREETSLVLTIKDDGVGFNVGSVDANYEQRGSLGMVNMRERAELAGGLLSVTSAEREGTTIEMVLPLFDSPDTEALPPAD